MFETFKLSMIISFSTELNSLLFFLKRIPLIKYLCRNVGYEHNGVTKGIVVVALIFKVIKVFLKRIIALCFAFIPIILVKNADNISVQRLFWHMFISFYVILPVLYSKMLEQSKRKFISVKLMRMDAKRFVMADYFPEWVARIIMEIPIFVILAVLIKIPIWLIIFMIVAKNLFAIFIEKLHLLYYEKTKRIFEKKIALTLVLSTIVILIGYYPIVTNTPIVMSEIALIIIGILCMSLGIFSFSYIKEYPNFTVAVNDSNKYSDLSINKQQISKDAQFRTVKLKKYSITDQEIDMSIQSTKEGFAYINDIFFKRHKQVLMKPIILQSICIVGIFIIAFVSSFFINNFNTIYVSVVKRIYAAFIFVLYSLSTGSKATKAMFYNCDISLLHFQFYRKKQALLSTFAVRLKYLTATNLIPATLLGAALLLLDVFTGGSGLSLLPVVVLILVISVFFSVHNLFLYYMFQPFTTDLSIKNPLYSLFNFITYVLCYICLQIDGVPIAFGIGVIIATIVYIIGALVVVYNLAPKTFVIK